MFYYICCIKSHTKTQKMNNFYDQMPTENQFDNFIVWYNEENEQMRKNADYRMQNYYNCVDDYSWGGLCDQAANESYGKRFRLHNDLVIQMRDGAFVDDIEISVLADMDGNIVSDKIVNGRFGECWIIKNGGNVEFVGVAKKQATYNKKGYKVMTIVYKVEFYYLTNGKIVSRLLNEKLVDLILENQTTYKPLELFVALNNN
jgi:hypothetical protein